MKFWHGLSDYQHGQAIQEQASARVEQMRGCELHGFEFQPTITLGRRAILESDVLEGAEQLRERAFSVYHVDRGGEATLHNPGQLVIYPIVDLRALNFAVRQFIEYLELTTVQWLAAYGVEAGVKKGCPGVYTSRGKIGFVGVRIRRGVSTHGISINVKNNLQDFQMIRSCGVLRPSLDRLADWNIDAENKLLFLHWSELFFSGLLLDRKPFPRLTHGPFVLRS